MFCQKCGKEINDDAVVCVGCGCSVQQKSSVSDNQSTKEAKESNSTANCALLFAFLLPIVGIIMGIIGVCKYKTPKYKQRCITAIIVSIVVWIISFALMAAIGL